MRTLLVGGAAVALWLVACPAFSFISIEGNRFLDEQGRQILLHGVSISAIGEDTAEDYANMRDWGFNCVRLGVNWDGLEPEPGKFSEAYMGKMDQCIEWAGQNGLYVFLDMHQDLFSSKFIDGAPAWATLDEGKPFVSRGAALSDAYFTSQPVQAAFDNFWANKPAPDGLGLQDHYANLWRCIAERYAQNPTVIGYDLMNEPFIGSDALKVQLMLLPKLAGMLATPSSGGSFGLFDLLAKWNDASVRRELLKRLDDIDLYRAVVDTTQPLFHAFDKNSLVPFYRRVANAIRQVDRRHVLFLETTIASNMGVRSAITPVLGADGTPDPLQAYAPHAYDLVTDTPDVASPSNQRMELILERHGETANRLGMPMLVGEWGAYGMTSGCLPAARFVVGQFERLLCGETYWRYNKNAPAASAWKAIQRPFPARIAGRLLEYHSDVADGTLTCAWKEDLNGTAPTQVYVRDYWPAPSAGSSESNFDIVLTPPGKGHDIARVSPQSANVFVNVPGSGEGVARRLEIRSKTPH